jgi:alpha-amylase/alpha-mannosidase (GH57 family)
METKKIKVVLCWHMHQPHYRDGLDGLYRLPWVYLHAIKDYADMAWHLENCPAAKVVVNFAPVLLEQLDDYQQQMQAWLKSAKPMQDPLLNLVAGVTPIPSEPGLRAEIVMACQRAYAPTMINVFPHFRELVDMVQCHNAPVGIDNVCISYLNSQFFTDLLMWYHLAWMGVSLRHCDARVNKLMAKKSQYTAEDQRCLMQIMTDAVASIIPRYKALMQRGQIEISMTPYGHPIMPLLIDFASMRDALPDAPAPSYAAYPDGYERARWHMLHGIEVYEHYFGQAPRGVWLSEGALSSAAVGLLDEFDISWTASGEGVWRHSCEASHLNQHDIDSKRALYQPLQHGSQNCALFFRDDGLSDMVGFQYKDWHPQDAANDFAHHMENIAYFLGDAVEEHVVSVILDGENAWEYYPDNAHHFLSKMYDKLSSHPRIQMTTFAGALKQGAVQRHLPILKSGSWVYGSFSTWIGETDKNRGWDLLVEAKQAFDKVVAHGTLTPLALKQVTEQLAVCEGSDWFWWFGGYNPTGSVRDFDQLYRRHLTRLYQMLNVAVPENLSIAISYGGGDMENSGTMRRN